MAGITNPFVLLGLVSFFLMLAMAGWTLRKRSGAGADSYAVLAVVVGVWSLAYVLQFMAPDLGSKLFWFRFSNTLSHALVLSWLWFASRYAGRGDLVDAYRVVALGFVSLGVVAASWLTDGFVVQAEVVTGGSLEVLSMEFGLVFWIHIAYLYAVISAGLVLLAGRFLGSLHLYRRQAVSVSLAALVPFMASALYVSEGVGSVPDLNPFPGVELTPYAFTASALLIGWGFFNYRLLDLNPVGRTSVVDGMRDAVVVFDREDRIVDANQRVAALLGTDRGDLLGRSFEEAFSGYPSVSNYYRGGEGANGELVMDWKGVKMYFDVEVSPLLDSRGKRAGRVMVLRDLTRRRRWEQELERQNERLDEFAGMVSHDLRNPLDVSKVYIDALRRDIIEGLGDVPDNLDGVEAAIGDAEEIVEHVLSLARNGRTVTETTDVRLEEATEEAWSQVGTGDAELVVESNHEFGAEENRLLRVFANLFRNAVEHGEAATVRVGGLDGGFYVEDDGHGIPRWERGDVLEYGYTTSEEGTGLGLAIVVNAVEAHGWSVEVGESREGGARFEITGVTTAEGGVG